MNSLILLFCCLVLAFLTFSTLWLYKSRDYESSLSVASAYDSWTDDRLLERLWGEHVHLGFYENFSSHKDFRTAKIDFVHHLIKWSGLDKLPAGSRILDVGCGIGGSARILAEEYGFDVLGITISSSQVDRARQLTAEGLLCRFEVMDALNLRLENGSFDGVWSVEAGPHMPDKQLYADEMLRVLRPGGVLAVADWNLRKENPDKSSFFEQFVLRQLLNQWAHPSFSSIDGFRANLLNSRFSGSKVEIDDWTKYTFKSWSESIWEGFRRPGAILFLGPLAVFKALREIPTILLMRWAFKKGIMRFGVFHTRG